MAEHWWESAARSRSYPRYVTVGAIVALIAVALGALTLGLTFREIRKEEDHQFKVLAPATRNLAEAYRYFIDQETAMRGYVLTSNRDFLGPYINAQTNIPDRIVRLQALMNHIADGPERLERVEREYRDWLENVAEVEIAYMDTGQRSKAVEVVASGIGLQNFDEIRDAVEVLEEAIASERDRSDRALSDLEENLVVLVIVTLLGLILMIGLTAWLLRYRVLDPLAEELEEQAGLIDLSQDAIITRDVEGPITFWSRGAEALYGYRKEEAVGVKLRDLLKTKLPEPKAVIQEKFFRDGFWTGLIGHEGKNGDEILVASRWVLRRNHDGTPQSIFEVNTNVSDRALTALRASTVEQSRRGSAKRKGDRPDLKDLQQAVATDGIHGQYQPIVRMEDHRIVGLEALMRWTHPVKGLLTPDGFLDEAIENDLIDAMSQILLRKAIRDLDGWKDEGLFLSLNLESHQIFAPGLASRLHNTVTAARLDPARVWLEIPESLYAEHFSGAIHVVTELREMGFTIALDDFGTGTSSLDWLARIPVDVLKVDRRFVNGAASRIGDQAVLRAVSGIGKELGLVLVAEGIETREQRDVLFDLGYHFGQGYLFSRPVEQDDLLEKVLPQIHLRNEFATR